MTEKQNIDIPNVEAPPQRLAVTKSRKDSSARSTADRATGTRGERSNAQRLASKQSKPANETVSMSLGDRDESYVQPASAVTDGSEAAKDSQPVAPLDRQSTGRIADMSEQEMAAAFESQPKHIKEIALKQLAAAISKTAEPTFQPEDIASAIAKAKDDQHNLPADTGKKPAIPANRLPGANSDDPKAGSTAGSDSAPLAKKNEAANESGPTADETVADLAGKGKPGKGEVQQTSASKDSQQDSMIQQAGAPSMGDPSEGEPSGQDKDEANDAVASETAKFSDEVLYTELLKRLSKTPLGESEGDRASRLIRQRYLMVLAGNPDAAVDQIDEMSTDEQEFLRHQLLGLWDMVDPEGHPVASRRYTIALPRLREATKFAAAATDSLDVRSLAFCTAIESYGQVKTFSGNRFEAGQQVILYCEIENFTVNETTDGFETHLQGSYDIYNADDEKVVSQLLPADKQISANYLRDYFIAYQMHLPQQLSAGTYRLKLTMEDVTGKKYGQASIPLEIAK